MKMSMWLEKFILWVNILPCHDCCGCSSLWARCLWIEFALDKVLVGKVPGFSSIVWGYNFALQNKNIVRLNYSSSSISG